MTDPKNSAEFVSFQSASKFLAPIARTKRSRPSKPGQPAIQLRIENALRLDATDDLITTAVAFPDKLLVVACNGDSVSVPWSAIRALQKLPVEQRAQFEIEKFGSYLHWPEADIHLDLDGFRTAVTPELREAAKLTLRAHNEMLGAAMRRLRERAGIHQSQIAGVSERQVRRAEKGEVQPRMDTYRALAEAHGLSVNDYLNALAEEAARADANTESSP